MDDTPFHPFNPCRPHPQHERLFIHPHRYIAPISPTHPKPSFPALGLSTTLSSPYTPANCFATSCVPSGLASSTIITSHSSDLYISSAMTTKPHASLNVCARSQTMMGRFLRSLYVGRMIEYLSAGGLVVEVYLQSSLVFSVRDDMSIAWCDMSCTLQRFNRWLEGRGPVTYRDSAAERLSKVTFPISWYEIRAWQLVFVLWRILPLAIVSTIQMDHDPWSYASKQSLTYNLHQSLECRLCEREKSRRLSSELLETRKPIQPVQRGNEGRDIPPSFGCLCFQHARARRGARRAIAADVQTTQVYHRAAIIKDATRKEEKRCHPHPPFIVLSISYSPPSSNPIHTRQTRRKQQDSITNAPLYRRIDISKRINIGKRTMASWTAFFRTYA